MIADGCCELATGAACAAVNKQQGNPRAKNVKETNETRLMDVALRMRSRQAGLFFENNLSRSHSFISQSSHGGISTVGFGGRVDRAAAAIVRSAQGIRTSLGGEVSGLSACVGDCTKAAPQPWYHVFCNLRTAKEIETFDHRLPPPNCTCGSSATFWFAEPK